MFLRRRCQREISGNFPGNLHVPDEKDFPEIAQSKQGNSCQGQSGSRMAGKTLRTTLNVGKMSDQPVPVTGTGTRVTLGMGLEQKAR